MRQWDQRRLMRIIKRDRRATLPQIAENFNDGPPTSVALSAQQIQLLPWPAYSPDMPPIELLQDLVGRRLTASYSFKRRTPGIQANNIECSFTSRHSISVTSDRCLPECVIERHCGLTPGVMS
ncbi:hypothetical protein TNCV_325031 [Trichonephila clavipes]|nr:hypothetical protein TNCV_325031 [Trichonephila clavipes]